jgi:DNA-binding transcriptional ArsR family regulator
MNASSKEGPTGTDVRSEETVRLLKELANENRLMIMCALSEAEMSVSELNERIDLSQSALSQHLARLRTQGMVQTRRRGQTICYSLAEDTQALPIICLLHDMFCPTPKTG